MSTEHSNGTEAAPRPYRKGWDAWSTVAKCLDGRGANFTRDDQERFEQCTGRVRPPSERPREMVIVKGRRCGGTEFMAAKTIRAASFRRYRLSPGERAICSCSSADRAQARVLFEYATAPYREVGELRGLVQTRPAWRALREMVIRETRWAVDLVGNVSIEVSTADHRRLRGRTLVDANDDEVAYWTSPEDGSNPASAIIAAQRPALVTQNGQLLIVSTPNGKSDVLWALFDRYYGRDDPGIIVWRAASRVMNPLIPERVVLDALERDEVSARAEWLAQFKDDVSALVTSERLRQVVVPGRGPLDPDQEIDYLAFMDASGGSGQDSMTLAICHGEVVNDGASERGVIVIDQAVEAKPPFDPLLVARSFAGMCKTYRCWKVYGDAWAKGWVESTLDRLGLRYETTVLSRSEIYVQFLTMVNSRQVELPDDPRLVEQIMGLQRRPGTSGRDQVDHASGRHDDLSNAVAGCAVHALQALRHAGRALAW